MQQPQLEEQATDEICTRIKELAPISMLPLDVLEEIFAILVSWVHTNDSSLSWTQVCRSWRYISLSATRFWTCIDITNQRFMHHFLERSGTAPLHLIAVKRRWLELKSEGLCTHVLRLSSARIQSINVCLLPEQVADLFVDLGPDLENLESLSLASYTSSMLNIAPPSHLKKLTLDRVSVSWKMCSGLTELTHLSLVDHYAPGMSPSWTELFTILEGAPGLQSLHVTDIKLNAADFKPPSKCIALPNLRDLTLGLDSHATLALLNSIILPPSTRFRLNIQGAADPHAFLPARYLAEFKSRHFHSLCLSESSIHFFESETTVSSMANSSDSKPAISIGFRYSTHHDAMHYLYNIAQSFDLSNITALEAQMDFPRISASILLLDCMPNIEIIRVHSNNFVAGIPFILGTSNVSIKSRFGIKIHTRMLCPRLRRIFFRRPDGRMGVFRIPPKRLVRARLSAGIPLTAIEFHGVDKIPPLSGNELLYEKLGDEVVIRTEIPPIYFHLGLGLYYFVGL